MIYKHSLADKWVLNGSEWQIAEGALNGEGKFNGLNQTTFEDIMYLMPQPASLSRSTARP